MKKNIIKYILGSIFFVFLMLFDSVFAAGPVAMPPSDLITSLDGNVKIGVSSLYGGAITYYKDSRISDNTVANGNIIDYSNAGTLFTTAIWTLPVNEQERQYCSDNNKVGGVCSNTLPFNNPTQGGYLGDGWAGNPNSTSVVVLNNKIYISYRAVNYNYGYSPTVKPLTSANKNEWQTDFWGDIEISFHPILKDVVVIDSKITYCKDMNSGCANKTITTQDNQLSTLFAAGSSHPNASFRGPYTKSAYYKDDVGIQYNTSDSVTAYNNLENWTALLQNSNNGIGVSVYNYKPIDNNRFGYSLGNWPSISAIQPELNKFDYYGLSRVATDIVRYEFQPGGWYKFRTYVATGDINKIRWDLLRAQNPDFSGNISENVNGSVDLFSCNGFSGWARNTQNLAEKLNMRADISVYDDSTSKISRSAIANNYRSDLTGVCPGDGKCGFTIALTDLPASFVGKKLKVNIYGESTTGKNMIYSEKTNVIGPCYPTSTPTPTPTLSPTPTSTPIPTVTPIPTATVTPTPTPSIKVTPTPIVTLNPAVKILANGSEDSIYVAYNTTAVLSWAAVNTTSCTASGYWFGSKLTSGTQLTDNIFSPRTYTITCVGPGGSASDSVTISLASGSSSITPTPWKSANSPMIFMLSTNPSIAVGETVAIVWSSVNTSSCMASGAWAGSRDVSGVETVTPNQTSVYTLTCSGSGGSSDQSLTINVGGTVTSTPNINGSLSTGVNNFVFQKNLYFGIRGNDVLELQKLLAQDKEVYPEGITSGYFGTLTRKAVQNFQKKYGIVSSGSEQTTGFGLVGPKTRIKLNEL